MTDGRLAVPVLMLVKRKERVMTYGAQQSTSLSESESSPKRRTVQLGWHLPLELIEQVRVIARQRGVRPRQLVITILSEALPSYSQPTPSTVLERRMLEAQARARWH